MQVIDRLINTRTFAEFRTLMLFYTTLGWKWKHGKQPNENMEAWVLGRDHTLVEYGDNFMISNREEFENFERRNLLTQLLPGELKAHLLEQLEKSDLCDNHKKELYLKITGNIPKIISFEEFAEEAGLSLPEPEPEILVPKIKDVIPAAVSDPGISYADVIANPYFIVLKEGVFGERAGIDWEMWDRLVDAVSQVRKFYQEKSNICHDNE